MTNWKEYKLGEICTKIGSGATPRGGNDTYLEFGKYALIRSQNILDFTFSYNGLVYISEDQAQKLNNVSIAENDILLNITGDSVARVCQVPKNLIPARVNQHVAIIRPNESIIRNDFLKYFLLNPVFKEYMLMLSSSGATRNAITKGMIENFPIFAPDLPTQTAIAEILSSLDDKIELNNKINQELENLAQTLFKQWFIDFEFPDENGNPYKSSGGEMVDSELGEIPKGWEVGNISKIGTNIRDNIKPTEFNSSIPYIGLEHIPRKSLSINNWGFSTDVDSNKSRFKQKDILFGKLRPYFHKVLIAPFNGICSTDIFVLRPIRSLYYGYLLFHLFSDEIITYSTNVSGGTRMPRVSWTDIAKYKICLPSEIVLSEFTLMVESFIAQIQINIKENQELTNLRDTLLPKLISGELEVAEIISEKI